LNIQPGNYTIQDNLRGKWLDLGEKQPSNLKNNQDAGEVLLWAIDENPLYFSFDPELNFFWAPSLLIQPTNGLISNILNADYPF